MLELLGEHIEKQGCGKVAEKKLLGWREIPIGAMNDRPGSSAEYHIGAWRTFRPVVDHEKCTRCGLCWIYCPDAAMQPREDGYYEPNLDYCKGCGICANSCPVGAIEMVSEVR
ncbi:MAG: 4Fe-4S binding protein [Candidatus Verstraetearchaeota archaeon]|nr:4Fe-4S binding protein [Candidatus Verstraetearchaeota archaeon]